MKKMIFDTKQPRIAIMDLDGESRDVLICVNEQEVAVPASEESNERTEYEYDSNLFRTYKDISEDVIEENLDYYLDYEGDEKPSDEMIAYANQQIDEYTAQLIEEGVI